MHISWWKISHIAGGCIRLQSVLEIYLQKQFAYRSLAITLYHFLFSSSTLENYPEFHSLWARTPSFLAALHYYHYWQRKERGEIPLFLTEILKRDIHLLPKERVKLITNKMWVKNWFGCFTRTELSRCQLLQLCLAALVSFVVLQPFMHGRPKCWIIRPLLCASDAVWVFEERNLWCTEGESKPRGLGSREMALKAKAPANKPDDLSLIPDPTWCPHRQEEVIVGNQTQVFSKRSECS